MKLTNEQSRAIDEDEHLVVTANAGSGKTKTLVDRYLRILDNKDIRVKNIVAITFTRKAASEMLARIAEELNKKIQDKTDSSKKKYQDLRRDLINNRITTIHSFCSRILRDFPIEADIPVNFSEISEFESQGLIESAILETIEDILDKDYEFYDEAVDFLQKYDYKKVKQYLEILLSKSESYFLLEDIYSDENFEQSIISKGIESIRCKLLDIYKVLNDKFAQPFIRQGLRTDIKNYDTFQNITDLIETGYRKLQNKNSFSDFYSFFLLTNQLYEELKTKPKRKNFVNAIFNEKMNEVENTTLKDLINEIWKGSLCKINEIMQFDKDNSLSIEMIANAKFLSDLAKITQKKIKKEKSENAWVDFNDMIILSSFVLREFPGVSERISRDIRHLMVDEFQDTNRLQYDIVKNLVRELLPGEDNSNIKLYIVGDAKQSIYRFRSADVSVFNQAIEDIQTTVNNRKKDSNEAFDSNIKLSVCFRLTPAVTAGVNFIFSNMFEKDAKNKEYYIAYEPLVYGRNIIEFDKQFSEIDQEGLSSVPFGSFNVLLTQTPNNHSTKENDEEFFSSEAEVVAKKILSIVNEEKSQYQVKLLSDKQRFPEFRDITIISRTRGEFKKLSDTFIEHNIPFTLAGSSGFYNSQEIIDLISFLKYLNNPLDNTALASILKSPFFNLSDTDLMNIAYFNLKSSFDSNLHYIADDSNNCAENTFFLQRASKILKELKVNVHKLSISSLLRKIIDISVWESSIIGQRSAPRMKANARKLIEIAEGFESRGYKNLYDFIEELIALEKQSSEGEADFIADENTVKIMTIHAAKGLEFPIVFLYNTSRRGNHSSGFYIDNDFGITLPNFRNLENSAIRVSSTSAIHHLAKENDSIADDAENKRILYVAMTRAEDHLFISSTYIKLISKTNNGVSVYGLAKMIFDSMELDLVNIVQQYPEYVLNVLVEMKGMNEKIYNYELPINFLITPFPNDDESEESEEFEESEEIAKIEEIESIIPIEEIESEQVNEAQSNGSHPENELILLNCNLDTAESNYFSATRFITYKNNEQAYIDRYILSMPDFEDKPLLISNSLHQEHPETITGSFAGSIIHKVFEQIGVWCNSAGIINEEKLSDLISYEINALGKIVPERFITEILKECISTAETKLIQHNINSVIAGKKELTLVMPIAQDFYYTQFDLLININENIGESQYEVWDWKSNKVKDKNQIPSLAEHYLPQMEFYGLMLSKYNPNQEIFRCKLLFTKLAIKSITETDWTYTFEFKNEDLQKIEEKYYEISRKIKNT